MRFKVSINKRDVAAIALLCLLGVAAVLQVSAASASKIAGMGAGILPVALGALLMSIGVLWLFDSRLSPDEEDDTRIGASKWRDSCGPASGAFVFLLAGKFIGVVPACFALVYISVLGDARHTWRSAFILALAAATLAALVMRWKPELSLFVLL